MEYKGKFVLTGGPGIGKTRLIEILAEKGFAIVSETAREVIEEERINNRGFLPWEDLQEFQHLVALRQLAKEEAVNTIPLFFDRGLVDGHAYCALGPVPVLEIINEKGMSRYEKIFILEPLESYLNDDVRFEDRDSAMRIHEQIIKSYNTFGYETINVPVLAPLERVEFILQNSGIVSTK